ncbi:MAG: PKD domain-containing protein [Bacteroidota bacterium]
MRLRTWVTTFLTGVCLLSFLGGSAQRILETQYFFGNSADNFVFDKNGREIYEEERMASPFGSGGPAVLSDQFTGNLLLYSDGVQIYDQSHQPIVGTVALSGDSAINQAAVVVPNSGTTNRYFILTNPYDGGPNEIQVSEVNMGLQGNSPDPTFPYGELISANVGTGLTNPSEAMLIVEVGDGRSYWLLSQDRTNFNFRVTAINSTGIDSTQVFDLASAQNPGFEAAAFAFNADSSLAVAPKTPNRNVAILSFNTQTGELTFDQQILQTGFDDGQGESIYDVEWSPSGQRLYMSRFGSSGIEANILQLDFDTLALNTVLPNPIFRSYGLQRGLDDNILHLYQEAPGSEFFVGQIMAADSIADSVMYVAEVLDADFQARQFPAFSPPNFTDFQNVSFQTLDVCQQQTTKFYPITDTIPSSYFWNFGDGNFSTNAAPVHTYEMPGGYPVTLRVEINGRSTAVTQFVEILQNDFMVNLGNDTTICVDEVLTLDPGDMGQGLAYTWSTGETTPTIDVDTTGTYWVEVLSPNGNGCTSFDAIVVTEYGIQRQLSNQWYFGEMAGIDFNEQPPAALVDDNLMESPEGCATISDTDGSLLFYTNGNTVWNKDHQIMVNGTDLGGDSTSAQSSLILPFPDDETMFYVFATQEVYGDMRNRLLVSIVDIKDDTARGSVVVKGIELQHENTERLTASGFGNDGWLLSHEFGNNNFRAQFVSAEGIGAAVHSPIGEFLNFVDEPSGTSYTRFQPGIARVVNLVPDINTFDILDFDNQMGSLNNVRNINTNEPASTPLYGVEFGGAGNRLYLTTSTKLMQYDLDSIDTDNEVAEIEASKFDGYPQSTNYGALQLGPNGVIYMALDNAGNVASIDAPTGDDLGASFNPQGIDLMGRNSRRGLPNFTQQVSDPIQPPGFTVENACFGQPITLLATGTSDIDEFEWTFDEDADPMMGVGDSIQVTYNTLGMHTIQLRIFNRCGYDSLFMQDIEVFQVPPSPQVPSNAALCDSVLVLEALPEDLDDPSLTYNWSTGDSTRTITITQSTIVDVFITNSDGCTSDTLDTFVGPAITVDLGPDQTLCQNDSIPDLDSQNAAGIFNWTIDGAPSSTTRFQPIDTSVPGVYTYAIQYTEPITSCIASDTTIITVLENPVFSTSTTPPTTCDADDGEISITIDSNGSFLYSWTGPQSQGPQSFDGPGTPPSFTGLGAGNYQTTVENIVTGCTTESPALVEDIAEFEVVLQPVPDCGDNGELLVNITGIIPPTVNLTLTDDTGQQIFTDTGVAPPIEAITPLDTGLYIIEVEEIGGLGCIQFDSATLGEAFPRSNFVLTPIQELCGTRDQVEIIPGTNGVATYTWADDDGNIVGVGESVDISLAGTYFISAQGEELCPRTEEFTVNINPFPDVTIQADGDLCTGSITLSAVIDSTSAGPFSYQWFFGPDRTVIGQTETIDATQEGVYQVQISDPMIGCDATSFPINVQCDPRINAPNAFYPGSEIISNQNFYVFPNNFIENFEVFVYSRWGELVFYSDQIDFQWDGAYRGQPLPLGTYAYVFKFTARDEPDTGVIEQYGSVTIIR